MEALMLISRDALKATDHARGAGATRAFNPCELDCVERVEAACDAMINRSVVMIRLLMRALYCGSTVHIQKRQKIIPRRE